MMAMMPATERMVSCQPKGRPSQKFKRSCQSALISSLLQFHGGVHGPQVEGGGETGGHPHLPRRDALVQLHGQGEARALAAQAELLAGGELQALGVLRREMRVG